MNGKKKGPRWGRPLLLPMRVCTVGYAVGTPRVSKPAHGVLLVPAFNFDNKVFGSPSGCPQEAEELFVATERNAKLRYEGYKKLSEM